MIDWLSAYQVIFFDFDGLLVNSEHLHFRAYQLMLKRRGFSLDANFETYAGVAHMSSGGLRQWITTKFPPLAQIEWTTLYAEKKAIYQQLIEQGDLNLMPGVDSLLKMVQEANIKHCVVTNSTKQQVEAIQSHLPVLKSIPLWITREDYAAPKPAPDSYLEARKQLAKDGDRLIGFEDSLRGIEALKGADIDPVLICSPTHHQMKDPNAKDLVHYASFEDMISNLSQTHHLK